MESMWARPCRASPIFMQQDNAKLHINPNDDDFIEAVGAMSYTNISMNCQPQIAQIQIYSIWDFLMSFKPYNINLQPITLTN